MNNLDQAVKLLNALDELVYRMGKESPETHRIALEILNERTHDFALPANIRHSYRLLLPALRKIGEAS